MAETAKWYVVHTYSGYENTVKATIEKTVESRHLQDQILAVSIPLETVTEITESGASKTYDRKVYPGYVLVKMVYSDDTWHVIKDVRGVTGFVGSSSNDPTPLTDEEVYEMGVEKREIVVNYTVGDTVRWKVWMLTRMRSAWLCPCSAVRLPLSLNSIRWKSFPNKRIGPVIRSERGRGLKPRQKCAKRIITTSYSGGAFLWHRKSLALSSFKSTPQRRPLLPL